MEEMIKPNDYVRTHKGKIYKVTNVYILKITCGHTSLRYNDIKSHSQNIIDLIEVGDYVNGHLVVDKRKEEVQEIEVESDYLIHHCLKEEDIKSIVTHGSFNSIKYEVI